MYFAVIVAGSLIFGSLIMANPQDSPLRCVGKDGADQVCLPNNEGEVAVCYFMHQSGYGQKEDQSWQGCMQYPKHDRDVQNCGTDRCVLRNTWQGLPPTCCCKESYCNQKYFYF